MSQGGNPPLEVPEGLLPAQLGVVIVGRPVLGHAAATLVSLAERGFLQVTETKSRVSGALDWQTRRFPGRGHGQDMPERFEKPLLDCLAPESGAVTLSAHTAENLAPALRRFAHELIKDSVHHGWLRHLRHGERTPHGDELADRIHSYRTALRRLKSADGDALGDHLPYALVFGMAPADSLPLARFAAAFVGACTGLPHWRPPEQRHGPPDFLDFPRDDPWRGLPAGAGNWAIVP